MNLPLVKLRANIMLLVAAFIWGVTFVAQKSAMQFLGPMTFNGARCLIGAFSLLIVALFIKDRQKRKTDDLIEGGVVAGVLLCIGTTLQQIGIVETTAGKAGFISSLYIVMVAVFSFFLGKRIAKTVWFAIGLAILGLYFLSSPSGGLMMGRGDFLVFLSAIFFAMHIIAISKYALKTNPIHLSCVQFFVAGIFAVILGLIFETTTAQGFSNCLFELFCAGVLSCGIAFTLQISAQKFVRPYIASLILSTESIFSVIMGFLILNEVLSVKEIFGCILLLIAVYVAQVKRE